MDLCISHTVSPSSQRAWIEIALVLSPHITRCVALLAEGVDRNKALSWHGRLSVQVALLAEGVDRNYYPVFANLGEQASPSSQRAWIEICRAGFTATAEVVALLAEGVDRNTYGYSM